MRCSKSTTTLSIALALPILASGSASLNAQSSVGGPGTSGGATTSRSQIGVRSPAGVVLPNANGTGLGTSQPSYIQSYQGLNQNSQTGSFQVPRRAAPTLATVPQTRCPDIATSPRATTGSTGTRTATATTGSIGRGVTAPPTSSSDTGTTGATVTTGATGATGATATTTTMADGSAAQALAASTGSRSAGLTPVGGTGSVRGNCQP
jgi:hypothetical protein